MSAKSTRVKVLSFRIPEYEYQALMNLSKKSGIRVGPIARGLMRKSFEKYESKDLLALIRIGSFFRE